MTKTAIVLLVTLLFHNPLFSQRTDSSQKKGIFLELSPMASYDLGKCVRLNAGINRNSHSWYIGIQSHLNTFGDFGQPDNYITRNNGYAKEASHYLHGNIGYQRNFSVNPNFEPFFYVDLVGGKVGLVSKVYGFGGTDSSGVHHYFTSLSNSSYRFIDANFLQLSLGVGCRVHFTKSISLSSRVGLGEAFVSYRYVGGYARETTIDHFLICYSVGVQYNFQKH